MGPGLRAYRLLLFAFPPAMRREFGDDTWSLGPIIWIGRG